jgi:A/G-specific adenine glycosylase
MMATLGMALFPAQVKPLLRRRLRAWFRYNQRDLPWRNTRDPYAVWLSEVMLQQTQVVTVIPYFKRFLRKWPSITALARAKEADVLRAWEGLGYYRRARQLHAAAKVIVEQHQGNFPTDPGAVRKLPGIGRYTAGAILSIAFDQRQPILEANTQRLFARLLPLKEDLASAKSQETLWQAAEELLPQRGVGEFNQALMELGALICKPREPDCEHCPALGFCPTQIQGDWEIVPRAKSRPKTIQLRAAVVAVRHRGRLLMRQYVEGDRWQGLWDFLRFPSPISPKPAQLTMIHHALKDHFGVTVRALSALETVRHSVTKYRIALDCYQADWRAGKIPTGGELKWIDASELAALPLHITARRFATRLLQS